MKKLLPILFILALFCGAVKTSFAQIANPVGNSSINVAASIGEYYLNISGYASPYASIVLTIDSFIVRATVADQTGNFYISQVLVKSGLSNFCLETVDFKRLGSSVACFPVSPVKSNIMVKEVFLPPTIGLANAEIPAGSDAVVFGYTMPEAKVTLHIGNGKTLVGVADKTGYYTITIKKLEVGRYELYAKAEYNSKESLISSKTVSLRALSWWEQLLLFLKNLWERLIKLITSVALGPLWIGIPVLVTIVVLLIKIWPEKFTFIYENRLFTLMPFKGKEKLLHHAWWIGY